MSTDDNEARRTSLGQEHHLIGHVPCPDYALTINAVVRTYGFCEVLEFCRALCRQLRIQLTRLRIRFYMNQNQANVGRAGLDDRAPNGTIIGD